MENLHLIIAQVFILFFSISFHESAHAWMAYKLGDPTGKMQRRISLNPLRHLDLIGTIILPVFLLVIRSPFLFGWAKPVPVNPFNFKDPYKGIALTSLSGPASNLILAASSFILIQIIKNLNLGFFSEPVYLILVLMLIINLLLALFNLLPVPPLDGSGIVMGFFPNSIGKLIEKFQPFSIIILFLIIGSGIFNKFFNLILSLIEKWIFQ